MFQGFYHDAKDIVDQKSYYYLSFVEHLYSNPGTASEALTEDVLHIVKINSATGSIVYNYRNAQVAGLGTYQNLRVPGKLVADPVD